MRDPWPCDRSVLLAPVAQANMLHTPEGQPGPWRGSACVAPLPNHAAVTCAGWCAPKQHSVLVATAAITPPYATIHVNSVLSL
jgi:hypothetical protein